MKAIQFTIDEQLLTRVDQDPEVREKGRSAFLRRAISAYLRAKRERSIREAYERGYGDTPPTEDELGPWPEVQEWPDG
jgi:metal-responsive CopG/Arc/MetJ family transcriptional regulator